MLESLKNFFQIFLQENNAHMIYAGKNILNDKKINVSKR